MVRSFWLPGINALLTHSSEAAPAFALPDLRQARGVFGGFEEEFAVDQKPGSVCELSIVCRSFSYGVLAYFRIDGAGRKEENDPLTFNGLQITPSADNQLPINSPLQVFF